MRIGNAVEARAKQDVIKTHKRSATPEDFAQAQAEERLKANADRLEVSKETQQKLKEQQASMAHQLQQLKNIMEQTKEAAKAQADSLDTAQKCFVIASRIMSGDEVSQKDQRFLAKNDSQLYMQAIMLRRQREDPQKYKTISDKEKDASPEALACTGIETPAAAPPPAPEGGEAGGGEGAAQG